MAIVLADDFDAGQAAFDAAWTNANAPLPGITLFPGGCDVSGFLVACNNGPAATRALSITGNEVSVRGIVAYIGDSTDHASARTIWSVHFPVNTAPTNRANMRVGLLVCADGRVGVYRSFTDFTGPVAYSSAGAHPIDGTFFALQGRITRASSTVFTAVIEVNNTVQLTATLDWSAFIGTTGGSAPGFDLIRLDTVHFAGNRIAYDTLEVDDSSSHVNWGLCAAVSINADCEVENIPVACPDPCADAGVGEPYLALAAEQNQTLFYDRSWTLVSLVSTPMACALAPAGGGKVWIAMDDVPNSTTILYRVDPNTIDPNTSEATIEQTVTSVTDENDLPITIGELGGFHALHTLSCLQLLTVDRATHDLIAICLPAEDATSGTAQVVTRYSLNVTPLDSALVDSRKNLVYLDGGDAKVFNLRNDAVLRTVGSVGGGTWPVVLNDNTFLVRDSDEILRYSRLGVLIKRWNWVVLAPNVSLSRLYGLAADLQTDACGDCGNSKDGAIFIPGETPATGITLRLIDTPLSFGDPGGGGFGGSTSTTVTLTDVVDGGIDTASAFIAINATDTGAGFSTQDGGNVRRPSPNRHCGPDTQLTTVHPNPGCNAGGKGWTRSYTGASGVVPTCTDPVGDETLTGKSSIYTDVAIQHANGSEVLRYALVDLDDTERKEGRIRSIGDVEHGARTDMESASINIQIMEADGRPIGTRLTDSTKKYFARDEVLVRARSDYGRRTSATPRMIGRALLYGESYGTPLVAQLTAVDPLFIEGGSFSPDKKVPQHCYPLSYYTGAPPDMAKLPMPIIYGEVSDEGAVNPITGLPNSRGKCPVRYVGMDVLGTAPGGVAWGRFNICRHAVYSIIALYGSDCGGLNLYGQAAVTVLVGAHESDEEDLAATATESIVVTLDGSPDLSGVATDGTMQLVLWATSGRTELVIVGVDNFAKSVTVEGTVDPTHAQGVNWYLSSIDYVPRRVKIDLATRNGVDVQVPTQAGYIRPTPYEDFTSIEGDFRVTDMWATGPLLSAHLAGEVTMSVNGVFMEDNGDGSGLPIVDYFRAYNHFWDNFVHRQVMKPSGAGVLWPQVQAEVPLWSDGFSKTKESSFTAAQALSAQQLGGTGLHVSAYFGEGIGIRDAVQLWNDNGNCRTYMDEYGRVNIWLLDVSSDSSTWPIIEHVSRVFGDVRRWRALDEAMNVVQGGCDWDPDGQQYREDDLAVMATSAITRNASIKRYSKHVEGKLIAEKSQFTAVLNQILGLHQDGPIYVSIESGDIGFLDYPIGSGIRFTSIMGPGASGYVEQPMIILRRTFHVDSHLVSLLCLDVGPGSASGDTGSDSVLIPSAQQFILTNNISGPTLSNTLSVAPVLAA